MTALALGCSPAKNRTTTPTDGTISSNDDGTAQGSKSYAPPGYRDLAIGMNVPNLEQALPFYEDVMGARVIQRLYGPDHVLWNARVMVGDTALIMTNADSHHRSPAEVGGSPLRFFLYVEDGKAVYDRAIAAGAEPLQPIRDLFWGDRAGQVRDPSGHIWYIGTHIEDISNEEFTRRAREEIALFAAGKTPKWELRPTASDYKPPGAMSVTPTAIVDDVEAAIAFYPQALSASVIRRVDDAEGTAIFSELRLGDSLLRVTKSYPEYEHKSAPSLGGTPAGFYLYVPVVEQTCDTAVEHHAGLIHPVIDPSFGERFCSLADTLGMVWGVATFVEPVSPEVMQERFLEFLSQFVEGGTH
ncbi:MAG: VOC family protein [Myxococcales bacterium]|nr:VOC family protein [Myxococcales bacterium]